MGLQQQRLRANTAGESPLHDARLMQCESYWMMDSMRLRWLNGSIYLEHRFTGSKPQQPSCNQVRPVTGATSLRCRRVEETERWLAALIRFGAGLPSPLAKAGHYREVNNGSKIAARKRSRPLHPYSISKMLV
jgi:hypothetical protein